MSNSLSNNAVELPVRDGSAPKPNVIEASSTKDISQPTSKDESIMVREPLSNLKNSLIVFIFETLNSAAYYVSLSIGLLKYLSWGLSIIQVMQGVLIYSSIETLAQVLAAVLSDKTQTPIGRRKPFMLVGNIIQFVSVFFLCLPPASLTNTQLFAWYISFQSLSWGGFMFYFFPFKSWLIENSVDDEDYRRIRSVAVPIGALVGGISGTLLMVFSPVTCAYYNLIGGAIALALMIFFTPSKPFRESDRVPQIIPSIRLCSVSKEFRQVFINQVFIEGCINTYNAIMVLLLITSYDVKKEGTASMLYLLVSIIGGIIGVAFNVSCNWIFTKIDKLQVYKVLLWICVFICVITFFISFDPSNFPGVIIIGVIFGIIGAPANLIFNMFIRDLVIYDTFVTEYKRANMYISAILIPSNIISKFLAQIPIVVITLIGFKSYEVDDDRVENTYSWTEGCVWAIRAFSSFFIALFAAICYFAMKDYPLTGNVVNKMNEIITNRDSDALTEGSSKKTDDQDNNNKSLDQQSTNKKQLVHHLGKINHDSSNSSHAEVSHIDEVGEDCESRPMPIADTSSLSKHEDQSSITTFSDEEKQLLLHLSKSELYRIFSSFSTTVEPSNNNNSNNNSYSQIGSQQVVCANTNDHDHQPSASNTDSHVTSGNHNKTNHVTIKYSSLQGLHAIRAVVIGSLTASVIIIALLIAALVLDSHHLDGVFSTLLIYLVLLMGFLVVYELFRVVALQSLTSWTADALHHKAHLLYHELISEKQSVESVIKHVSGIDVDVIDEEVKVPRQAGDEEDALVTGNVTDNTVACPTENIEGVDERNDNDLVDYPRQVAVALDKVKKSEEDVVEQEAYFTFGYEYILAFQVICLGLAVFVLVYASQH